MLLPSHESNRQTRYNRAPTIRRIILKGGDCGLAELAGPAGRNTGQGANAATKLGYRLLIYLPSFPVAFLSRPWPIPSGRG